MKQKKYLILAAAAALFAACSSDDGPTAPEQQAAAQAGGVPVAFDTYVNRGTTRAGLIGELTTSTGSKHLQTANVGFGVFAYYTNADNYDQTFQPNFMYNTHVTYVGSAWTYTPLKYWPNEFGTNALSDDVDKVSFFAYAPFVSVNPASGKVKDNHDNTYGEDNGNITFGIVGMKSNSATGDPMVKYISSFYTSKQVDLTWATTGDDNVSWVRKNGTPDQTIKGGRPWLNVEHPSATTGATQQVNFVFQHSLAALNVTVDTKTDGTDVATAADDTKVFIRSVTFEGFDTKGALNLNNGSEDENANIALWYNFDCENELNNGNEVTIKDGRKDGKEGVTPATKEYAAINPTFVQSKVWAETTDGVTKTAGNLFAYDETSTVPGVNDYIYVIPNGDKLKVTIEYDVLTKDPKLAGKLNDGVTNGSVVKNVITRYITVDQKGSVGEAGGDVKLANGKKYLIKLHLGLNSVEFDAKVTEWATGDTSGADLPRNN